MTDQEETAVAPKGKRRLAIGAGVIAVAVAGVAIATQGDPDVAWSAEERAVALVAVSPTPTATPTAEAKAGDTARGIVKAKNEATIASRITARITAMPFREGKSFAKGALLASFDCSQTRAQLTAARAAAQAYRTTYETNQELDDYNAIGKNEVEVAKANLGKAEAEAQAIGAELSDCEVHAPFAGTVVEEIGHAQEIAASGQPLLKIQSGGDLKIELIAPSGWLTWLEPGKPFRFRIDETGKEVAGVVTGFGASVDAVSKTIRVNADITDRAGLVLPGMSGSAIFDRAKTGVASTSARTDGKSS